MYISIKAVYEYFASIIIWGEGRRSNDHLWVSGDGSMGLNRFKWSEPVSVCRCMQGFTLFELILGKKERARWYR